MQVASSFGHKTRHLSDDVVQTQEQSTRGEGGTGGVGGEGGQVSDEHEGSDGGENGSKNGRAKGNEYRYDG